MPNTTNGPQAKKRMRKTNKIMNLKSLIAQAALTPRRHAATQWQDLISRCHSMAKQLVPLLSRGPYLCMALCFSLCLTTLESQAGKLNSLEQIPLDTFAKLREVERYQLQQAEKMYIAENYKIAMNEYDKYLSLYETSLAAPYALLMWSHCQVKQRKLNTAIRDGFQSVIDYWPESNEAVLATFLIARAQKDMGQTATAEKSYRNIMQDYPDHQISFLSKMDLLDIAKGKKDEELRVSLLKDISTNTKVTKENKGQIDGATREYAEIEFRAGNFKQATDTLEKHFETGSLERFVSEGAYRGIEHLIRDEKTKAQADKMANDAIAWLMARDPNDITTDAAKAHSKALWFWTSDLQRAARRPADVLKTYEAMSKRFGNSDDILGRIADWYKGMKRWDDARKVFARYENTIEGSRAIAYSYRQEGKLKQAIENYRNLMTQDGDRAGEYQWAMAECYQETGDHKSAIANYRQADRYPEAYFRMAHCHRKMKQTNEALVLYNQAKANDGSAPEAVLQIGFTYEEAGEKEKAIKTFQQTCRKFPKSSQASRAHAHLQNKYNISVTLGGAQDE